MEIAKLSLSRVIVEVFQRSLGWYDVLCVYIWRVWRIRILLIILRLSLIFGRAVSASPCVDKSQCFSVPDLVHQQQADGNEGDDNDGKSRSSFGQRDNENDNGDDDLHDRVQMNPQITLDASW